MVPRSVKPDGWAILNAEDEQCLKVLQTLQCNVAYFSDDADEASTKMLLASGDTVAYCQNGYLIINHN